MHRKIIKDTSIVSFGTLISRVLGFIRDILVADFFGTSGLLEAFLVSFRIPNVFRSICAEGFVDSAATPVLAEYEGDKEKIFDIGHLLISFSIIVLTIITVIGVVFSKYFVMLVAPGFASQADKFELAVSFTRVTFFYLFLMSLSVNASAILNGLKKFFIPAVNPSFLNLAFILGIICLNHVFKQFILVFCTILAGVLQLLVVAIALKKEGYVLKLRFKEVFKDKIIGRMTKLFIPRLWSSIVYQINVFIDTIYASLSSIVGQGAMAGIYYSDRLIQCPLALIALSLSRVLVVDLSAYHNKNKTEDFKRLILFSFQNVLFFVLPVVFLFCFLSREIVDVLFKRGEFDQNSLILTASTLFYYSFGLLFFCGIKVLVFAFYALKDTKTPAITATIALFINAITSGILIFPLKIGGAALGTSIAAFCNFLFLYYYLEKRIGKISFASIKGQCLKIITLSLLIGIESRILWDIISGNKYHKALLVGIITSLSFLVLASILKISQIEYIKGLILSKIKK